MADTLHADFAAASPMRNRPLLAIAVGGCIVGVLDILYAIVVYSAKRPIRIPQTIAGGLLGLKSYSGGGQTAVLGVILHFFIAFTAAAIYYFVSRKFPLLIQRAILCGIAYGGLVYLFMHLIVLPLSALPRGHAHLIYQVAEFIEHLFFVGLPISLSVRHYSR